ncbi:MAG: hypothetical protein ACTS6P_00505 [Candidatus Hodgkinia cicadicola]
MKYISRRKLYLCFALAINYPPNVNVSFTLGLYYYFLRRTRL